MIDLTIIKDKYFIYLHLTNKIVQGDKNVKFFFTWSYSVDIY